MQNCRLPSYAQNYECKCENIGWRLSRIAVSFARWWLWKNGMTVRGCSPISHDNKRGTGPVKHPNEIGVKHEFLMWRALFDLRVFRNSWNFTRESRDSRRRQRWWVVCMLTSMKVLLYSNKLNKKVYQMYIKDVD